VVFSRHADCRDKACADVDEFVRDFSVSIKQPLRGDESSNEFQLEDCACSIISSGALPSKSASCASAPARMTQPRCFLPRTSFRTAQGTRVTAAGLRRDGGDVILGPRGKVKVLKVTRHPPQDRDIVSLKTQKMSYPFQIGADHRVEVSSEKRSAPRRLTAKELQESVQANTDNFFLHDAGEEPQLILTASVKLESTEMIEITFENDDPIFAWLLPKNSHGRRPPLDDDLCVTCFGSRLRIDDKYNLPVKNSFLDFRNDSLELPRRRSQSV